MALLPYLVNTIVDDYDPLFYEPYYVNRYTAPSYLGLSTPLNSGYLRMLRHLDPEDSGISSIQDTKEDMKITLDVKDFKPDEVKVKVVDNFVVIEGKHEERKDEHGFISREFTRRYRLPPNAKVEAISSNISSDGVLQITAPKKPEAAKQNVREIKVIPTNKPAIKEESKESKKSSAGPEKMET